MISQGDILKVEGLQGLFLVVSKNTFNLTEQAILCPVATNLRPAALRIYVKGRETEGIAVCDQIKLIDLRRRGYSYRDQITQADIMNITDAIQGMFDYC